MPVNHWCRKVMNDDTERRVAQLPRALMSALEISGRAWANHGWKSYHAVAYPEFDLIYDRVDEKLFDIIIAEQVLEHVKYPYRAVRNVHRMLMPGGYFLLTLPFLIQIHGGPQMQDYTRWTPTGLRYFLEECGFDPRHITVEGWGNIDCAVTDMRNCAEGRRWTVYEEGKHDLRNERDYPVVVWGIAQKI
jgi:SAM-dependent methyltransferase